MYTRETIETIAYVLRTLTDTRLEDVGEVGGPWLDFSPIEIKNGEGTIGKIEFESEIGWYYIPIEAYEEEATDGPS